MNFKILHYYKVKVAIGCLIILIILIAMLFSLEYIYGSPNEYYFGNGDTSMLPTYTPGELIAINRYAYKQSKPLRWDVVVFHDIGILGDKFIGVGRIAGLPREIISYSKKGIIIDGRQLDKPSYLSKITYTCNPSDWDSSNHTINFPYKVPANSYFILGDNVRVADDSRFKGAVPFKNIIGKVITKGK